MLSHILSHSSQGKAATQRQIEKWRKVSNWLKVYSARSSSNFHPVEPSLVGLLIDELNQGWVKVYSARPWNNFDLVVVNAYRQVQHDECSSGVMRVHIPYLVCVVCVQWIAKNQSELAQTYITEERRAELEKKVQGCEDKIQQWKQRIAEFNSDLARGVGELAELGETIATTTVQTACACYLPICRAQTLQGAV